MEPADLNYSNWICVNQYQIIPPPRQYPDSFRQPKTTPRNLPDTLQTPQNRKLNGQSRVNERKGTSQLKQHSMFLHRSFINWFGMMTLQTVSRVTNTPSWHLPDTVKSINVGIAKGIGKKDRSWMWLYKLNAEVIAFCLGVSGGFLYGVWLILDVAKTVLME